MANRKNTFNKTKIAGIASAMMLVSADISALGLGVLDVQSNLDQPLNGVIELRINSGDDVNSVEASIASRDDFANLGIDYPSYLDNINVTLDRSSGVAKLRIDSNNVIIQEPFIHFLMRVDWSGGSFLREYTALIDPPVYAAETPKSVSTPKLVGSDSSVRPSSTVSSYSSDFNDSRPTYSEQSYSSATDARYGPVEAGETLSFIASQLANQYPDLSIYQVMKVLFEQNPSAFINGNINGLIKGAVLNVGDINAIRAVDVQSGKDFFAEQAASWSGRAPSNNIKVTQDQYNDSGDELVASTGGSVQESFQVGASTDTDSLISDSDSDTSSGEAIILKQQVSELESSLSSSAQENQELKERISILEAQLTDMQNLVSLGVEIDDANLASLENSLSKANEIETAPELQAALDNAIDAPVDAISDGLDTLGNELQSGVDGLETDLNDIDVDVDVDSNGIDAGLNDIGVDSSAIDTGLNELGVSEEVVDDASSFVEDTSDSSVIESSVEEVKPEPKKKPIIVNKPEPSLFEKIKSAIFDGGIWKLVAGLGVILVGALAAFFIRRRRADEEFEISMLSIESNSQSINTLEDPSLSRSMSASVTASIMEADEADGEVSTSPDQETSFLTVYSDSDAVVQADEVDPIAEADVYIAYGRHEQAEEVLLDGMSNYPDRTDIKHKLLTVYHKNNNSAGFERIAEELYSQRETLDPKAWQEICSMGKEIDESNPLFELSVDDIAAAGAVATVSPAAESTENEPEELMADIDAPINESLPNAEADNEDIQLINFDEGRSEISELDEVAIDALDVDESANVELSTDDIDVQLDDADEDVELTVEIDDDLEFSTDVSDELEVDQDIVSTDDVADIDFDLNDDDDQEFDVGDLQDCLLYTSPSPRDLSTSRMPSSA